MHPESHACHAKRMSQHVISYVHATRPDANPHGTAPPTRPATRPRHTLRRARHARSPQPATRNARSPCVHATRSEPNPQAHGTAPRHARGHAQSTRPIPAACHAKRCPARPPVAPFPTPATRHRRNDAAPQRERRSEPDSRFRKLRRCHPRRPNRRI